jgi:hypothetical protein
VEEESRRQILKEALFKLQKPYASEEEEEGKLVTCGLISS